METEDIWRAIKTEKKKGGESIWRRETSSVEEKNKEEGENVWRIIRKISGEQKYVACKEEGKGRNIWRSIWSLEEKKVILPHLEVLGLI